MQPYSKLYNMEFKNKNVLITGGSDGIGKAIAKAFANEGANVWIVARNKEKLEVFKAQLLADTRATNVRIEALDLCDDVKLVDFMKKVTTEWQAMDVLVNNAGVGIFKALPELSLNDYNLMMDLNVKAPVLLIQAFIPLLNKNNGAIINVSSYLAERMMPQLKTSVYSATKGAINSLTKSLALELGPNIRVNAIAPGTVKTPLAERNMSKLGPEKQASLKNYIYNHYPAKQLGASEDIANMALYLASNKSSWISGAIFNVDGGITVT